MRFVRREIKRGNRYDGVILDPPTFGHGAKRDTWKLQDDLPELLRMCGELTVEQRAFVLLTCHTSGYESDKLRALLAESLGTGENGRLEAGALSLKDPRGRDLPSGHMVRWSAIE
jgi:23S rRNA (cytosine1962-C5)-methyltransferase